MKILLVNLTEAPDKASGFLSQAAPQLPQIGIAFIAASLDAGGHHVKIVDLHVEGLKPDDIVDLLRNDQYQVVGFSVYVTTEKRTLNLAEKIKARFPEIKICVGGPQPTLAPENYMQNFIDYIFLGEADLTFLELINDLENKIPASTERKGFLYKNGSGWEGIKEIALIDDLDALPSADLDRYYDMSRFHPPAMVRGKKSTPMVTVRGCPYPCTFCAVAAINGKEFRKISVSRAVDNIEKLSSKGYDSFMIYDDTFTLNKKRAVDFSKELIKRKLKIQWNCWSRVDCVDDNTLSYMRKAGCYLITFGCESMNDKTLEKLKKGYSAEENFRGIETTKRNGLLANSSFMLGLPGETKEDILNTINTVPKLGLDLAFFPVYEPYKGTPLYEDCKAEGHWIDDERFKNRLLVEQREVWESNLIKRDSVEKLSVLGFRKFYLRPSWIPRFYNILNQLPVQRKSKLILAGLDYFILRYLPFIPKKNEGMLFK